MVGVYLRIITGTFFRAPVGAVIGNDREALLSIFGSTVRIDCLSISTAEKMRSHLPVALATMLASSTIISRSLSGNRSSYASVLLRHRRTFTRRVGRCGEISYLEPWVVAEEP